MPPAAFSPALRQAISTLSTSGVATAPGIDFDVEQGHRFIRFSFAGSTATIEGALDAMDRFLRR